MKVLSLNCQRGYQPGLKDFLLETLQSGEYDFILLQEFAKEVPSFVRGVGQYRLLEAYDGAMDESLQLCVAYRQEYQLVENDFETFPTAEPDPIVGAKHSTFGLLCGRFSVQDTTVSVGSLHMHAGMSRAVRKMQMEIIKERVLAFRRSGDIVIFGGDCNLGPFEHAAIEALLAPEFTWATGGLPPTLDGAYSENVARLPNRVAAFLRLFGIHVRLRTDHIFIDVKTAAESRVKVRVLPDRVSDHSPVEILIT